MEAEIIKADKGYRDQIWLLYSGLILAGVLAFKYLIPKGLAHLNELGLMDLLVTLRMLYMVVLVSFIPAAVYLIRVGMRIMEHGCYPYPGRRVMFDTKVIRGETAQKRGKNLIWLGTTFLVLMTISMVFTYLRMGSWINNKEWRRFYGNPSRSALVIMSVPVENIEPLS